ncbi:MAG: A/G-specific adenine glycosylase [Alphaproteobacteria bacterium]|nr:A/G-specific adenine glycosylase [Alphaproteobacteria bacterium]
MIRKTKILKTPSSAALLRWYDRCARDMPWRMKGGKRPDPYHELLSEFMLQQTQVATVIPYFLSFTKRWPSIAHLAKATLDEVRAEWSGLGYYRRAKFLHECAKVIVAQHKGIVPQDEAALRALPGIGAYTAAAIAAIAYDKKAVVVDGNVERVMARVFAVEEPLPGAKKKLYELAASCLPQKRFGDYAQAVMELGATICTPKNPQCPTCPWKNDCVAFASGTMERYPLKGAKQKTPQKFASVFIAMNKKGEVLLTRRAEKGLLGGMWEFPTTPWEQEKPTLHIERRHAPAKLVWQKLETPVRHVFSHFKLEMALRIGHSAAAFSVQDREYRWMKWKNLSTLALPTLTRNVADAARNHVKKS